MNGPFADEYWKVDVINWTWDFKCKKFSYGTVKKFKVHFCACGDVQQLKVIDFFEACVPVSQ
ncbi:hypothetical protein ACHAXS_000451 [Conticribra weissflogii]